MRTSTGSVAAPSSGPLLGTIVPVVAALLAAFFLGAVLFGAWLNFSPVPMEDSWHGMVDFYLDSLASPSAWWAQHNDHRIVVAKLLFWLDMRYLAGSGLLLVPVNIVLLLSTWWLLAAYARRLLDCSARGERVLVSAVLGMLCLAWIQNKNITSSFQSEFILVFLLPLLAFYCFARALDAGSKPLGWRASSLLLGVASAYCMLNGLLALPILAVLSWFCERSPRRAFFILLCAALSLAVFLIGYERSFANPAGITRLLEDPLHVLAFALAYLGGPWFAIFGRVEVAIAFGALAVALTLYLFFARRAYRAQSYALALVAYIVYVFATAGMTAVGRAIFDLTMATTSRYMTPTLIMWAALLILLLARSRHVARRAGLAVLVVAALLLPTQLGAFRMDAGLLNYTPQTKAVAALSLQLDIHDLNAKRKIVLFYDERNEAVFQRARNNRVAIFSERYAYPANQIGRRLQDVGGEPCAGQIKLQQLVDERRSAYKVGGALAPESTGTFRYILFGDAQGLVKGIAIPGRDTSGPGGAAGPLNFDGYIFASADFTGLRCIR